MHVTARKRAPFARIGQKWEQQPQILKDVNTGDEMLSSPPGAKVRFSSIYGGTSQKGQFLKIP